MSLRIFKPFSATALAVVGLWSGMAITASADTLPFTTGDTVSTSDTVSWGFTVHDCTGTSSICSETSGGPFGAATPFTMTLTLPTATDFSLSSATLNFSGTASSGPAGVASYSPSPAGSYISGYYEEPIYGCGFFGDEICYYESFPIYSSSYSGASANFTGQNYAVLTGVTDGVQSWSGSLTGGTLDLFALGFGSDLIGGGSLTLTGYRDASLSLAGISGSGFNAVTTFGVNYDGSGSESATLNLDGTPVTAAVPEPNGGAILLLGVGALIGLCRNRAKRTRVAQAEELA